MKLILGIPLVALFGANSLFAAPQGRPRAVTPSQVTPQQIAVAGRDGSRIFLSTAIFDPTSERVDFSAFSLGKGEESEYAIVQFRAGAAEAKEDLERRGVRFFGYLPDNAFQVRMSRATRTALAAHSAVRWIGDYEPGFKVQARLLPGSDDHTSEMTLLVFPDVSALKVAAILQSEFPHASQTHLLNDPVAPSLRFSVALSERDEFVRRAAAIASVSWIEPYDEPHFHNSDSSGPIQGGVAGEPGRTIFAHKITGTGQIVAVADSGLDSDMCFFRNLNGNNTVTDASRTIAPALGPVFPTQKVFAYWVQEGADEYDTDEPCIFDSNRFHGTHTAGSAAGDNTATASSGITGGVDTGDGMAPNAQILFQDIGTNGGCLDFTDPFNMFLQALEGGARIHSNSYGFDTAGAYSSFDQLVDRFLFDHEEMAIFFSAGNSGPRAGRIGSPGNAKNAVTVGALGHGTSSAAARFSGRGPTADGRIKPDIQAPGSDIISAEGNQIHGDGNCTTQPLSGTSMSTPTVAGGAALMRQYFGDGFYPTGSANKADRFEARASLIKAVLLNGTSALPVGGAFGNNVFGWGRVFLDNNLFFPGDSRKLRLWHLPNTQGLKTGESHSYQIQAGTGQELRATLVWSDPEGTPGAALSLVNNLDMTVTNDAGTFVANVFSASGDSILGGTADSRNNVEQVRFVAPAAGTYTIAVTGTNVPGNGRSYTNRQGYALAVSSASCGSKVSAAPAGLVATSNARMGVDLSWVNPPGTTAVQIYRATGSCETTTDYQYVGSSTGTTFTDVRAQGGQTYSYKLRGADGCGEGPRSDCMSITALGLCDLAPSFEGIATALADGGTNCRINLTWPAATSNCLLGQVVRYNIYRSTTPDFVPAVAPLATVTETSYSDTNVLSGTTYYYVVRAEDMVTGASGPNGGNEETNSFWLFATAFGAPGELGTWTDDGGDTNAYLTPETPWQVTAADAQRGTRSYRTAIVTGDILVKSGTCAALTSSSIALDNDAQLSYWVRYNLEHQWDGVIVEISSDGGVSWNDLPPTGGYPDTLALTQTPINVCGYLSSHGAFTGPAGNHNLTPWTEYKSSLTAYNGQTVKIRWRLTTQFEFGGLNLDTIAITNVKLPSACVAILSKPVATFSLVGPAPVKGSPVTFRDTSSNDPTSWLWSFGDGGTSTQQHPTHIFATAGSFLVRLEASNAQGTAEISRLIIVGNPSVTRRTRAVRR